MLKMRKTIFFLGMVFMFVGMSPFIFAKDDDKEDTKDKVSQEQGAQEKGNAYGRDHHAKETNKKHDSRAFKKDDNSDDDKEGAKDKVSKEQGAQGKGKAYGRPDKADVAQEEKKPVITEPVIIRENPKMGNENRVEEVVKTVETVTVIKEEKKEVVTPIIPPKTTALISFESLPAGAEVFINNALAGITPFQKEVFFGNHQLEFRKAGYKTFRNTSFNVGSSTIPLYKASLEKMKASFQILSSPPGATVVLNGQTVGVTPYNADNLEWGNYKVLVKLNGYIPSERIVIADAEQMTPVTINLVKESGAVKIMSLPDQADVLIDGVLKGKTPLVVDQLAVGLHSVVLKKPGYSDMTRDIVIEFGVQKDFSFTLVSDMGVLDVMSVPDSADLYINGSYIGKTPQKNLTIARGAHQILLRKEGYADHSEAITIIPGLPAVKNISLAQQKALLLIRTEPAGAKILISGTDYGMSPFVSDSFNAGTYTITLSKDNYNPLTTQVTLLPGDKKELVFNLTPITVAVEQVPVLKGVLSLQSVPSEASIVMNNTFVGKTPYVAMLLPGSYQVKLSLAGFSNVFISTVIESGKAASYSISFKPVPVYVSLDSSPQGAKIFLNDRFLGMTPLKTDLNAGNYILFAQKSNYMNYVTNIVVLGTEGSLSRMITLKSAVRVFKYSSVPEGAEVWYKNRVVGITPFEFTDVKDGIYDLTFRKSGYRDYAVKYVVANGQPDVLNVVLEAMKGNLLVISDPAAADVVLDGRRVGLSESLLKDIPAGYHRLSVKKFAYFDHNMNVLIPDNMTVTNKVTLIEKPKGNLQINSMPTGAKVYFNNTYLGMSPYLLQSYPEGTYSLLLKMKGYKHYKVNVNIRGNMTETVNATLVEGSNCCIGGCFGSFLVKPGVWYTGAALLTGLAGYSWYKMEKSGVNVTESNNYRDVRDYSAVGALGCLVTGFAMRLVF